MTTNFTASEHQMNLSVLQNKDPFIKCIEDSASQVAAYSFNSQTNEWEKTNIEGTLFVYTRSAAPINGFTIMNRLHPTDLVEPINKNLEFQLQDPFLLYRNSKSLIYGIWFYDREECARIGQLMNKLVQGATVGGKVSEPEVNVPSQQPVDILQLLSKAQDEYDKNKQNKDKPMQNESAPPTTTTMTDPQVPTHISLDVLFKKAQLHNNNGQTHEHNLVCGGSHSAFRLPPPSLQKQPTPTVEEIERKVHQPSPNTTLKKTLNIAPVSHHFSSSSTVSPSKSAIHDKSNGKAFTPVTSSHSTNFMLEALFSQQKQQQAKIHSPILSSSSSFILQEQTRTVSQSPLKTPSTHPLPQNTTILPNHLSHKPLLNPHHHQTLLPSFIESENSTLLSPLVFKSNSKHPTKRDDCLRVEGKEAPDSIPSKEQLRDILINLLQTDKDFMATIYKVYVDTLKR